MEDKNNRHIWIAIGCPKGGHANFKMGNDKKFICVTCGEDFTREVKEVGKFVKEEER